MPGSHDAPEPIYNNAASIRRALQTRVQCSDGREERLEVAIFRSNRRYVRPHPCWDYSARRWRDSILRLQIVGRGGAAQAL